MVNLIPFKSGIEDAKTQINFVGQDPREAFKDELTNIAFSIPRAIELNSVVRFRDKEDKAQKTSGWYIYSELPLSNGDDGVFAIATYGSWRTSEKTTWCSKTVNTMSTKERLNYHAQLESMKKRQAEEKIKLQDEVAKRACDIYIKAIDVADNAYLTRKQVTAYEGVKTSRNDLVVPLTFDGAITSLQFIKDDGTKLFLKGGKKKGCYFEIKGAEPVIYIAEGYSTAASIAMATNATVYVAFDAGNLYEVATYIKSKNTSAKIIIAGDDDHNKPENAGRTKATQTAEGLGLELIFPNNGHIDFNDLHVAEGLSALKKLLKPALEEYAEDKAQAKDSKASTANTHFVAPVGILGELADYYNTTAGNKQPYFAIQTALAIASIVCARNFETNFSNRSSLFFLNIGKSSTGKEHGKKVTEKVLAQAGCQDLIGSDGYHSGSAVFSALMDKPRHIATIDEFSKYLKAAQSKSSSHLMEANTMLMEVIGRLDGTLRPRAYAASLLTKEKRKELADMKITNPAITFVTMTTPDDFFNTIDATAIKDGFLNRFVICLSDAERTMREYKESIDVPETIINWIHAIQNRAGGGEELATEEPNNLQRLNFAIDAMNLHTEFQQFCIDKADEMEKFMLSEMTGRSNEMAMRIALISALADNPHATIIEAKHSEFAISWVKFNLLRLIEKLKLSVSGSEHEGQKKEILHAIREKKGKGITWVDMQKRPPFSKYKSRDLKEILLSLVESDLIDEDGFTSGRGRPTKIYKAIK